MKANCYFFFILKFKRFLSLLTIWIIYHYLSSLFVSIVGKKVRIYHNSGLLSKDCEYKSLNAEGNKIINKTKVINSNHFEEEIVFCELKVIIIYY